MNHTEPWSFTPAWWYIHAEACNAEELTYIDPITQAVVMTAWAHQERGVCCENKCRHCPWSFQGKSSSSG